MFGGAKLSTVNILYFKMFGGARLTAVNKL